MIEVTTDKRIDASKLCAEMGGVSLRVIGPDENGQTVIRTDAVTKRKLNAAVAAHKAKR